MMDIPRLESSALIAAFLLFSVCAKTNAQTACTPPTTRTWIIAEDALQHADTLWFGFDSLATRGSDSQLCEWEYPDIPPVPISFFFPFFYSEWYYPWGMGADYRPFHPAPKVDTFNVYFNYNLDSSYYPIHVRWSKADISRFCDSATVADDEGILFVSNMSSTEEASLPDRLFHGLTILVYGARFTILTGAAVPPNLPTGYTLSQNYPNPFNPTTSISYSVPTQSHVTVAIYDVLGREVRRLVQELKQPGEYSVTWDASSVPSGVYFYRLVAGGFVETKKMVLMR